MKTSSLSLPCLVLTFLLTAGCESTRLANRINEKADTFTALASDQQTYVQDAIVFPGDSTEMAYIALGKPTSIETKQKDGDTVEMWTYSKYYPSGQLANFLTTYSQTRNPNLHRKLNLETGKEIGSGTAGGSGDATPKVSRGNDLSLPDLPIYNLYVFFYEQKVVDVKIESLDQTTFMWLEEAIEMEKAAQLKEARES